MSANASSEVDNQKRSWFGRRFSSKESATTRSSASTNRPTSITNPSFVSFSDILRPRRTTGHNLRQQHSTIDETLVDIAVNAGSDISSLADKSRGTIDFFYTPPVS
jgi:hypothetical protein